MPAEALPNNLTAIIIDSDKSYRKALASIIRNNFKITDIYTCTTGREALGVARQSGKIDLVFCDSQIDDQAVLTLVADLKASESTASAHYILLSNNSKRDFLLEAASSGVNAFILKPFTTKAVTENVRKLIGGKPQRKTKRIKLFNTISGHVAFKGAKYKGDINDISKGGCMILLPPLDQGGTIFDKCAIRITFDEHSVDLTGELIRMERDTTSEEKKVAAAFIFKNLVGETAKKFETMWNAIDKSKSEQTPEDNSESKKAANE